MLTCLQIDVAIEIVVTATVFIYYSISRMNNRIRIFFWIYQEISHTLRLVISDIPSCRSTDCINSDGYRVDASLIETTISKSKIITSCNQTSCYSLNISFRIVFADITIRRRTITCTIRCQNLCFYCKRSRNVKWKSSVTFTINKTEIFLIVINFILIFIKEVTNQIIVNVSNTLLLCNNSHLTILCYSKRIDKTCLQSQGSFSSSCEGNTSSSTSFRNSLSLIQTISHIINSKSNSSICRRFATQIKSVLSFRTCYSSSCIQQLYCLFTNDRELTTICIVFRIILLWQSKCIFLSSCYTVSPIVIRIN